jgi:hypothetical protein
MSEFGTTLELKSARSSRCTVITDRTPENVAHRKPSPAGGAILETSPRHSSMHEKRTAVAYEKPGQFWLLTVYVVLV